MRSLARRLLVPLACSACLAPPPAAPPEAPEVAGVAVEPEGSVEPSAASPAPLVREGTLPALRADVFALRTDEGVLAFAGEPDGVVLLDLASGAARRLACGDARVLALAWGPRGERLAVWRHDGRLLIVDPAGELAPREHQLPAPSTQPTAWWHALAFVADGTRVVHAGGSRGAALIDVESGARLAPLGADESASTALAVSRDGARVAIGTRAGTVSVHDAVSGARLGPALEVPEFVGALDFSPDGARLAVGASDARARVWTLGDEDDVEVFSHVDADVFGDLFIGDVCFSPDGGRLVSTSASFWEARCWDLADGTQVWSEDYGGGTPSPLWARYASDGASVLLVVEGRVLDAERGTRQRTLVGREGRTNWVSSAGRYAWARERDELSLFDLVAGGAPRTWAVAPEGSKDE